MNNNDDVPVNITQMLLDHVSLSVEKLGWEENALETEKFYVKVEYEGINLQLFVKPKILLTSICLHGYEDSGLERQSVNWKIISGPFNIKRMKERKL